MYRKIPNHYPKLSHPEHDNDMILHWANVFRNMSSVSPMHGWPSIDTPRRDVTPPSMDGMLPRVEGPLQMEAQGVQDAVYQSPPMPTLHPEGIVPDGTMRGTPQHRSPSATGDGGSQPAGEQSK